MTVSPAAVACVALDNAIRVGAYTTPSGDSADWYDPFKPESHLFAGLLITDVAGLDNPVSSRDLRRAASGVDGGTLGPVTHGPRVLSLTGYLFARTKAGLDHGANWLARGLTGHLASSEQVDGVGVFEFYSACPSAFELCAAPNGVDSVVCYDRPGGWPQFVGVEAGGWVVSNTPVGVGCSLLAQGRIEYGPFPALQTASSLTSHDGICAADAWVVSGSAYTAWIGASDSTPSLCEATKPAAGTPYSGAGFQGVQWSFHSSSNSVSDWVTVEYDVDWLTVGEQATARFYQGTYNRLPLVAEYAFWGGSLDAGSQTLTSFATLLVANGASSATTTLYQQVLGRTPIASELAYWNSLTPVGRIVGICNSTEAAARMGMQVFTGPGQLTNAPPVAAYMRSSQTGALINPASQTGAGTGTHTATFNLTGTAADNMRFVVSSPGGVSNISASYSALAAEEWGTITLDHDNSAVTDTLGSPITSVAGMAAWFNTNAPGALAWTAVGSNVEAYGDTADLNEFLAFTDQVGSINPLVVVLGTRTSCPEVLSVSQWAAWLTSIDPGGYQWRAVDATRVCAVMPSTIAGNYGAFNIGDADGGLTPVETVVPIASVIGSTVDLTQRSSDYYRSVHSVGLYSGPTVQVLSTGNQSDQYTAEVHFELLAESPHMYTQPIPVVSETPMRYGSAIAPKTVDCDLPTSPYGTGCAVLPEVAALTPTTPGPWDLEFSADGVPASSLALQISGSDSFSSIVVSWVDRDSGATIVTHIGDTYRRSNSEWVIEPALTGPAAVFRHRPDWFYQTSLLAASGVVSGNVRVAAVINQLTAAEKAAARVWRSVTGSEIPVASLALWSGRLFAETHTVDQMVSALSAEGGYDLSLNALYQRALGRTPNSTETAVWAQYTADNSDVATAASIANSVEAGTYWDHPVWVGAATGQTALSASIGIARDSDIVSRYAATAELVHRVYIGTRNSAPSAAASEFWTAELLAGTSSLAGLTQALLDAPGSPTADVATLYARLLGRAALASEVAFWSGLPANERAGGIANSGESSTYFSHTPLDALGSGNTGTALRLVGSHLATVVVEEVSCFVPPSSVHIVCAEVLTGVVEPAAIVVTVRAGSAPLRNAKVVMIDDDSECARVGSDELCGHILGGFEISEIPAGSTLVIDPRSKRITLDVDGELWDGSRFVTGLGGGSARFVIYPAGATGSVFVESDAANTGDAEVTIEAARQLSALAVTL